eukprot:7845553-Alexandrium_andersonii.AAC.1
MEGNPSPIPENVELLEALEAGTARDQDQPQVLPPKLSCPELPRAAQSLSLIHISEPTRLALI